MDLIGMKYLEDLHDPFQVVVLVLLLSLVPLWASAVTTILRRSGVTLRGISQGRLGMIAVIKHLRRRALLVVTALLLPFAVCFDVLALGELLTLPGGAWVAVIAILLGTVLGMLLTTRPRPRALVRGSIAMAVAVVIGALLFSGQFVAPTADGGYEQDATPGRSVAAPVPTPGTTAPRASGTTAPRASGTTAPRASGTTTPRATVAQRQYDSALLTLPQGAFTSSAICLDGYGSMQVSVKVISGAIVEAMLPDGRLVQVGDVAKLRPCTQPDGGADELHRAPGAAILLFDGSEFPLSAVGPVARIASFQSDSGEALAWVWRRVDGVMYSGILRADQFRD